MVFCARGLRLTEDSDRYTADRQSWRAQAQALITTRERELAAGARPRKLELDVGYHQELEAVNKRLDMDNRLMAPRVRGALPSAFALIGDSSRTHRGKLTSSSTSSVICDPTLSSRRNLWRVRPLLGVNGERSPRPGLRRARRWATHVPSIFCSLRARFALCDRATTGSAV